MKTYFRWLSFSTCLPNSPTVLVFFSTSDMSGCFPVRTDCKFQCKSEVLSVLRLDNKLIVAYSRKKKKSLYFDYLRVNFLTKQTNYFWSDRIPLISLWETNIRIRKHLWVHETLTINLHDFSSDILKSNPLMQQKMCSVLELFYDNLANCYLLKWLY